MAAPCGMQSSYRPGFRDSKTLAAARALTSAPCGYAGHMDIKGHLSTSTSPDVCQSGQINSICPHASAFHTLKALPPAVLEPGLEGRLSPFCRRESRG